MKINELNFRSLAYNYVLFYNCNPRQFAAFSAIFPSQIGDNAVLTYGYIDNQAGLSFEILCCARRNTNGKIEYRKGNASATLKIRYDAVPGDVEVIPYQLRFDVYQDKVDIISGNYGYGTDLVKIRKDTTFDRYRYPANPDDIQAVLYSPKAKGEVVWVRTSHIKDGKIAGELLNQPNSPVFGLSIGDTVVLIPINGADDCIVPVIELPWLYT